MTTAAWTCRTTAGADWGTQTADTHTNMLACHAAQYACGVLDACADWLGGWVSDLELLKTLIVFEVFRGSVLSNIIYIQKPNSLDWKLAPTLVLRHYFADAFTWCVCVCVCRSQEFRYLLEDLLERQCGHRNVSDELPWRRSAADSRQNLIAVASNHGLNHPNALIPNQ